MIEFRSVSKAYPDGTVAIENLSMTVPSHQTMALVGSSGSGKTTLLRMVNRMVEPTGGSVLIDDQDVRELDRVQLRRSIGYVMQAGGLLPHRTVAQNIATVPLLAGTPRRQARARALELLDQVGLETALAERYPGEISGGQQQRVGVARALAGDPDILLMDEPFGAVDPIMRAELQLVPLEDTEGLFLASHVVPLASDDVDDRAAEIIDAVDAALTAEGLVELNARSVDEQAPASTIASDWLGEQDLP